MVIKMDKRLTIRLVLGIALLFYIAIYPQKDGFYKAEASINTEMQHGKLAHQKIGKQQNQQARQL